MINVPQIWISDLTHTKQGISAATFPLGASYVYSYAKKFLGKEIDFKLFKFPEDLNNSLKTGFPKVMSFSNYSWNFELSYKFAHVCKQINPELIIREGEPIKEILNYVKDDPEVGILVLGAGTENSGPGPLVSQLSKSSGSLPIPVTIVPGNLSKEQLEAIT